MEEFEEIHFEISDFDEDMDLDLLEDYLMADGPDGYAAFAASEQEKFEYEIRNDPRLRGIFHPELDSPVSSSTQEDAPSEDTPALPGSTSPPTPSPSTSKLPSRRVRKNLQNDPNFDITKSKFKISLLL